MSLYRQAGRARRRRRITIGVAAALVALIVLVVVLATAGSSGPPSRADRVQAARAAASQARDGLELLGIEYGQAVKGGRVAAPTEYEAAKADVQRARKALTDHAADLDAVDPPARRRADAALATLAAAVNQRADIAAVLRASRAALAPFTSG
jgi:hypothetical protein